MLVSVGQFSPSGKLVQNLATIDSLAAQAAKENAKLLILPEESMFTIGRVDGDLEHAVEANWPEFEAGLSAIARKYHLAVIAGGYEPSGDHRPFNTLLALDDKGERLGTYRKLHLYDAFSYQESTRIRPGDSGVSVIDVDGLNIGLMTCYDVRFPEMARALADAGAQMIAIGAAWFKGDHKIEHWETLLKARAIENTVWIAAAGTVSSHTVGHSAILDPMGTAIDFLDEEAQEVVTVDVNPERISEVRAFLPVLQNRRFASNDTIVDVPAQP